MIRGVIFDLGNTLMYFDGDWADVNSRSILALDGYLIQSGIRVSDAFGAAFVEMRRKGRERAAQSDVEYTAEQSLRETFASHGHSDIAPETITRALELFFAPEEEHRVLYDDALATLGELHERGLRLGLLSNATDDAYIQRVVRRTGLAEFLDPIISSAGIAWRKPDPRAFRYVLDQWRLAPREVAMVGDWPTTDILGAHRVGMPAILIEERWTDPGALELELAMHLENPGADRALLRPDSVIQNLSELPAVIDAWKGRGE